MEKETLQERINKKELQIEKINKRITKWESKKNEKSFWKDKEWYWNEAYETRENFFNRRYNEYLEDCDEEIKRAKYDLKENQETLEKYQNQLQNIVNYEQEEKIQVLVDFLNDWEEKANNWYLENAKLFINLKAHEKEELAKAKQEPNYYKEFGESYNYGKDLDYWTARNWKKYYYSNVSMLTREIINYENKIDTEKLAKVLKNEKDRKYQDLVSRITEVVGTIKNAKALSIGDKNGEINGVVIGEKGTAEINTISAGGYNIQCFHYRVLVHKIN